MKTVLKLLLIAGNIMLVSCAQRQSAQQLLKNDKMRDEIMTAICNDHGMTEEMINHMTTIEPSRRMMSGSCNMMDSIMASDIMKKDTAMQNRVVSGMLKLLKRDSVLCDKTCTRMVEDQRIKRAIEKKM